VGGRCAAAGRVRAADAGLTRAGAAADLASWLTLVYGVSIVSRQRFF
jgi:hypothetical protein